ncbi:hypothetical protein [Lysobacter fragariae]
MALNKTERGRVALLAHSNTRLSLAERRALILCDGRRTREDIVALLGPNALSALEYLLHEGYLDLDAGSKPAPRLATANGVAIALDAAHVAKTTTVEVSPTPRPASRRSLAASRMYLLDMLQLQRDPESASLRAEIQTSPSDDETVYRLLRGLRHLQAVVSVGYAQRVGERLAELLPEAYLPRLDQTRTQWLEPSAEVA